MHLRGSGQVAWGHVAIFTVLALGLGLGSQLLAKRDADPVWNVVSVYSPLLAALMVRKFVAREGFADARLGIRGVKARYWILAAILPLSWNLADAAFDVLSGSCELHAGAILPGLSGWLLLLPGAAVFLVGEELGWRSYLVEKLRPAGPVTAFVVCGLVWFAWHPSVWFGPSATWRHGPDFFIYVMCLSFIFGWLYCASNSVWPCLAMHVFNNLARPRLVQGAMSCVTTTPILSEVVELVPLVLTVVVLWRHGAFSREPAREKVLRWRAEAH